MNQSSCALLLITLPVLGLAACGEVNSANPDAAPPADAAPAPDASDETPTPDATTAPDATPEPPRNLVFVTSEPTTGNIRGRDAADAMCNRLAHAAGRDGQFVAYLSTLSEHAIDRIENAQGWVRADGTPVANTASEVANGKLLTAISLDERGNPVPPPHLVWTATRVGQLTSGADRSTCADWTSETPTPAAAAYGDPHFGGHYFQFITQVACNSSGRLYCFQIDHRNPVAPPLAPNHKLAFVSAMSWSPQTGGVTAADAHCQQDAAAHGKSGRFRALLPTSGVSAASRFLSTDGPWKRADGMPLTKDGEKLFDDSKDLNAPLNLDLAGNYHAETVVFVGATGMSTAGTTATTCSNWTVATTGNALALRAGQVRRATISAECGNARHLRCLETNRTD